MHIMALFRWWYGAGWVDQFDLVGFRLAKIGDFFSISMLARNLFQPFRQISSGSVKGSLDVQFRALLDSLISRFVGATTRSLMIIVGGVLWLISAFITFAWLMVWPLLPVLPFLSLLLVAKLGGL